MSKLIQTIEHVGKSIPAPMGFVRSARSQEAPQVLVIASTNHWQKSTDIISDAKPDALLLNIEHKSFETLIKTGVPSPETPWGLVINESASTDFTALKASGCDFIVLKTLDIPVSQLQDDNLGRILQVPKDLEKEEAHALEDLPIDAVYLAEPASLPISLQDLMVLSAFRNEIPKPVILSVSEVPSVWEMECLRNIGIECVLIDFDSHNSQSIVDLKTIIKGLPKRKARNDKLTATLPEAVLGSIDDQDDQDDEDDQEI